LSDASDEGQKLKCRFVYLTFVTFITVVTGEPERPAANRSPNATNR
jgi:hypothetical protein